MVSEPEKFEDCDDLNKDASEDEAQESSPSSAMEVEDTQESGEELEALEEAPEMMFSQQNQDSREEQQVLVKYCLFCREIIPAEAIACKHCGHVVHIFEGGVFKQLYWFLWGGIIAFVGSFLPFLNGEVLVTANTTFAGSLYLVFALLLMVGMGMSIYSKRLIMSPVFLMFIPAFHTWWNVVKAVLATEDYQWFDLFYNVDALTSLSNSVGSGTMLLWIGSSIIVLTFLGSIFSAVVGGGNKDKAAGKKDKAKSKGRGRRR